MARRLEGCTALVTGASRGVGRAVAEAYAREGARLVVTATDIAHLAGTVGSCRELGAPEAVAVPLDLADPDHPARAGREATAALGTVDVLVNNAGLLGRRRALADHPIDLFERVMDVSVVGALRLYQAVVPALRDGGAIINVTSGAAGRPWWGAYGVSRAAVNAMTDMLRAELADRAIRVVAINPGPARTRMRAAAYPDEDPRTVPAPSALTEPFVAVAAGHDPGPGVVQAQEWIR